MESALILYGINIQLYALSIQYRGAVDRFLFAAFQIDRVYVRGMTLSLMRNRTDFFIQAHDSPIDFFLPLSHPYDSRYRIYD